MDAQDAGEDDDLPPGADEGPGALLGGSEDAGDDATPICLRCFAPLEGSPTNCANCGAAASRAAMLGPAAGGGVDLGGSTVHGLAKEDDGHVGAWGYAIVWGMGMILIPMAFSLFLGAAAFRRADSFLGHPAFLAVVLALWTIACGMLIARRLRAARRAGKAERQAPEAF